MKFSTKRKLKKACSLLLVLTMVMSMFTALPAGIFAVVASAESMIALDAEATTIDFVNNDNGANAAAVLTSATSTYTMADGAVTLTGYFKNNGSHGIQTCTQDYGNKIAINAPAGKITVTMNLCNYGDSASCKLFDSNSSTPDVAVDEVTFTTGGCTTTTMEYEMKEAGVLTVAVAYNTYIHDISIKADSVKYLELDAEATTLDFVNNDNGANAAAALTSATSTYTMADGAVTLTGYFKNNGSHGIQTCTQDYGNKIAINAPAGKITVTMNLCNYGDSASCKLYDSNSSTPDEAVDEVAFTTGGCTTTTMEYEMKEAGVLTVAVAYNTYIHDISIKADSVKYLELDAEATTLDFVNNDNGANAAAALTSATSTYTMADGAVTFTGYFKNNGSHGIQTCTQDYGNKIAINAPAGKITVTMNLCNYQSEASCKLYDSNSATPDEAVADVAFTTGGCTTTTMEYIMSEAGVLTVAVAYNTYIHSISIKADTYNMLPLDGAATEINFVNNENGANAAAALTSNTSTYSMASGIVTLTGFYKDNATGGHGIQTCTQDYGNKIAINVPAGKITITLGICQYSAQGGVAKLYDSTSETPDVAVKEDIKFSTKGEEGAACTTTTVEYTTSANGVLTIALPYNCYLHSISAKAETAEVEELPVVDFTVSIGDTVVSTYDVKGDWKEAQIEAAIATRLAAALEDGATLTVTANANDTLAAELGAYTAIVNATDKTITVKAGDTVVAVITYKLVSEMGRLVLDGAGVSHIFSKNSSDCQNVVANCTGANAFYELSDGIVVVNGFFGEGNGHGIWTKQAGNTIAIRVPAGKITIDVGVCCYGNNSSEASLFDSSVSTTEAVATFICGDAANAAKDDTVRTIVYKTSEDCTLTLELPSNAYIHSLTAKAETAKDTAVVSGTVDAAVNGEKLVFMVGSAVVAETTIADGAYSVELEIGTEYTVAFENADTYEIISGVTVDLTEAEANATVTNDVTYSKWDAEKSFEITIGGTTFKVKPGASKAADFTAEVVSGDGKFEVAGPNEVILWANLGGAGTGKLSASKITSVSDTVTYAISEDAEYVTVTYKDGTSNPTSVVLTVKDNSATGTPTADGKVLSYDFKDGSILSKLYLKTTDRKVTGVDALTTEDKLVILNPGTSSFTYNDAAHGMVWGANASIKVKVAGNATVTLSLCQYANAGDIVVTCPDGGTVTPSSVAAMVGTDGATQSFAYTGDAGELVFTYTGSGSAYLHSMTVMNEAEKTTVTEQTAMPVILENIGTGSALVVTPNGQKLVLVQTGGSIGTVDGKVSPSVSYYAFPATSALNKLEMDVVLNTGLASNSSGIYVGAFNETGVSLLGIRNLTGLRGMYSKSASDMAGAGLVDETVTAGSKVHFVVEKKADKFVVTAIDENGKDYVAEFKYNNANHLLFLEDGKDTEVSFGFMVSSATATVTNMKYYDSEGNVLYSQNDCYAPIGTAPIASGINAEVADTRDSINVTWDINQAASGDGVFVLEMRYNDGEWVVLGETTETSYVYPLTKSGKYEFRVAGKLGSDGELNGYVYSEAFSITAALPKPVVTAKATDSSILLTWAAIDGAVKYEVYRYSYDEGVAGKVLLATVDAADGTEYADAVVDKDMPYYYTIIAYTEDNFSNPSDAVWAVVASNRTGEYVYEDEATEIFITKKSYDTVFNGEVVLEGAVGGAGSLQLVVNGENVGDAVALKKNGTFAFKTNVPEGRNEVELIFTDEAGNKTRQAYNFVYLTNYDFVVDKTNGTAEGVEINGKMTFNTVQAAVDAANGATRTVILVLAGDYEERLVVTKANVTIIGEDRENTLIHCYPADEQWGMGAAAEAGGDMDKRCAIYVKNTATNFSAENISFKNDYDYLTPDNKSNKSADAFRCDADNASYVNVKFTSVQDTLYLNDGTHYFNKCVIEGSVDFIYAGDATAVFDDCTIFFVYVESRDSGVICAPKTSAGVEYGLVFNNCVITADERCTGEKYRLARPWGADASVIWVNTYMGNILNAEVPYEDMSGNAASDARFYEFGSYGPGYAINADRRQISEAEANAAVDSAKSTAKASATIGSTNYVGDVTSDFEDKFVEDTYVPDITYGDLNGDGEVDTVDAVMIKQKLAGFTGLDIDEDAADVNCDGKIDTVDAVMLMQKLAGMDIELGK